MVAFDMLKRMIGKDLPPASIWAVSSFEDRAILICDAQMFPHRSPRAWCVLEMFLPDLRQREGV